MRLTLPLLLLTIILTSTLGRPQWPYRDSSHSASPGEYYGYQTRPSTHFYRNVPLTSSNSDEDDDEVLDARQDLKVATGQQPDSSAVVNGNAASAASPSVVVVETGSAKPVSTDPKVNNPAETKATGSGGPVGVPATNENKPAFPPATPPAAAPTTPPEDSEEDSDEDEEAGDEGEDEEQDDDDDDYDDDDSRRRSDIATNSTVATNSTQTVEALVPGYVTSQGEVLVPFDTVNSQGNDRVQVVEDPSGVVQVQATPPVVVMAQQPEKPTVQLPNNVPRFFHVSNNEIYYSDVPPPGSIFTFDEEDDNGDKFAGRGRAGDSSEEEEEDEEQDDESSEERSSAPKRPPLSFVKATAPSGEDDEAESLGIRGRRLGRRDRSRSPHLVHVGGGVYLPVYRGQDEMSSVDSVGPTYYYRPSSNEKVRVVPIGTVDLALEENVESGEVRPVVSYIPMTSNNPSRRRVSTSQYIRRPTAVSMTTKVRRPQQQSQQSQIRYIPKHAAQNILAMYGFGGNPTPVVRGRGSGSERRRGEREAKEMKKLVKQKKMAEPKKMAKKQQVVSSNVNNFKVKKN